MRRQGGETIGMRELRGNLAAYLRRASDGDRITVTVDGVPIARLGPVEPTGTPTLDDLVAAGLVAAPGRPAPEEPAEPVDPAVDIRIDDVLDELRGR